MKDFINDNGSSEEMKLENVKDEIKLDTDNKDKPDADIPTEEELAALSPDKRKQLFSALVKGIDDTVNKRVSELETEYSKGIAEARDTTVKQTFACSDKFVGFGENIAAIDSIIGKIPVLSTLPSEQKYTIAYLVNEGLKARENKAAMSAVDVVNIVNSRPDVKNLLEAQRLKEIENAYDKTPSFAVTGGTAGMPANIKSAPVSIDEATREAYSSFGIKI